MAKVAKGKPNTHPAGALVRERAQRDAAGPSKIPAKSPRANTEPAPAPQGRLALAGACLIAGIWAYWPCIEQLVRTWNREPDYSHGFLVVPVAIVILWLRRSRFPGLGATSPALAIGLLTISLALRYIGARYFFTFMDGWSLVPWVASIAAALGGWPLLRWSLPSIGFLIFMVPLPFRIEGELSAPLQRIATKLTTTTLQVLGQPAFSEGNVILIGENRLEVAQACSGLRLFVSVMALTYAYVAIVVRPWWEKVILVLSAIPCAIIANSARIVVTGLLFQYTDSASLRHIAHDWAGFGMILFAAAMFSLLLWYLKKLIREEEIADLESLVREART